MSSTHIVSPRPRIRFRAASSPTDDAQTAAPGREPGQPRVTADPAGRQRKREPNRGSFAKGSSGNRRGRPRGAKGMKTTVRKAFASRIDLQTKRGPRRVAIFGALLKKELQLAAEGDWRARRTVFELAKWALGETGENPLNPDDTAPGELTATGQAIIDWFVDEIRAQDNPEGDDR